jgi:hypothetical protein
VGPAATTPNENVYGQPIGLVEEEREEEDRKDQDALPVGFFHLAFFSNLRRYSEA